MNALTRLAVLLLLAPIIFVACSSNSSASATPTPAETVAGVEAPGLSTSTPSLGATSSTTQAEYSQYVAQICSTIVQFEDQLNSIKSQVQANPSGALKTVQGPIDTLSQNLRQAAPPADLQSWQSDLQQRVAAISTGLKSGDFSQVMKAFESPFPAVPSGATTRLQNAAKNNQDCQKANLFQ